MAPAGEPVTRPSRTTLQIHASPQGRRSGFATASDGLHSVSVLVLPKLWKDALVPLRRLVVPTGIRDISLQLHETERVNVECGAGHAALLRALSDTTEARRGEEAGESGEAEAFDEEPDRLLRVFGDEARGAELAAEPASSGRFVELLKLVLLSERAGGGSRGGATGSTAGGGLLVASDPDGVADPVLELVRRYEFAQLVLARLHEIRQGYVEVTEPLAAIRGRITDRSLAAFAATGVPTLECTHDEFTDATPLFRVIVSALDVVVAEAPLRGLVGGFHLAADVATEAEKARRHLCIVPSLPRRQAADAAARLRLTRLLSSWVPALELARAILLSVPPEFSPPKPDTVVVHAWWAETDKCWEQILIGALRCAGLPACAGNSANRNDRQGGARPWTRVSPLGGELAKGASQPRAKQPDILVTDPSWVLDAKYKGSRTSLRQFTPSPPDQYQIFAYSHVVKPGNRPAARCGLLIPLRRGAKQEDAKVYSRGGEGRPCDLHVLGADFPEGADLSSELAFAAYLSEAGASLSKGLNVEFGLDSDGR